MLTPIRRREFLKASGAVVAAAFAGCRQLASSGAAASAPAKRWFKGNLHMHNQWSDGEPLPEWAVDWYKSNGYHFICPSDHNIFQTDALRFDSFGSNLPPSDPAAFKGETSLWKMVSPKAGWAKLTQARIDQAVARFGKDSVRTLTVGGQTFVRMKPFAELEKQFVEPDRFLMIPGFEQTGGCPDGRQVHVNFINVREAFPYIAAEQPKEILERTYARGRDLYGRNYLFTANHPLWRYYDVSPADLIALPQIRLFELNNNEVTGGFDAHPQGWTPERCWDVVNAHRASHDQPLLLGMGSDDRHGYDGPAKAWSVVRAADLRVNDLLDAISAGDFYASNGLDFADIRFDGRTLSVKVDAREEGPYRILFLGTKRGYDPSSRTVDVAQGPRCPARRIDVYSESIGTALAAVEGTEGAYTLKSDDLYVRAKIVKVTPDLRPDWKSQPAAWSQPYRS